MNLIVGPRSWCLSVTPPGANKYQPREVIGTVRIPFRIENMTFIFLTLLKVTINTSDLNIFLALYLYSKLIVYH